jgi:hypothetical protein
MARSRYAGNWTGLFQTGSYNRIPPALDYERVYLSPNSPGFDGQFYHLIAHDPLLQHGFSQFVDNPRLRWRRILIPGAASLLSLGHPRFIDPAFFTVILAFVFLGTYWFSQYCCCYGLHPAWGLLFMCVPAVAISIDRMTVDIALAALCAGFALYAAKNAVWQLYFVLLLAPLARETGAALIAAFCMRLMIERQWARALRFSTAAAPFVIWMLFIVGRTSPDFTRWVSAMPLRGLLARTLHAVPYAVTSRGLALAGALDYLALLGVWLALAFAIRAMWTRSAGPLDIAIYIFAAFMAFLSEPDIWAQAYGFARTQSPLLMCIALQGLRSRSWQALAPMCLAAPRIAFEMFFEMKEAWPALLP